MFVNKISGVSTNIGFKGYQHIKSDIGEDIMKFNYPYDWENETCEIQIFRVHRQDNYSYKVDTNPITSFYLEPNGVDIDLQKLTNLDKDEAFAYKYIRRDKKTGEIISEGADTGVKMKLGKDNIGEFMLATGGPNSRKWVDIKDASGNKLYSYHTNDYADAISNYQYTLVSRKGTTPKIQGASYLAMPDAFKPGSKYRGFDEAGTGEIYYDKEHQKNMEDVIKTFSNRFGGNMAGLEDEIANLRKAGYRILFTNPIANGDDVAAHSYWNKNNMQIASTMGTTENFASLFRELYKNGMKYVYDGTFTSEGLEGIHFQYALRWANHNPQTYHWFRMSDLKNTNLGLGVVPENKKNLRHRIVNPPYIYTQEADGKITKKANPDYNPDKETLCQIYDASQVTKDQVNKLDKPIRFYENLKSGTEIDINDHDDTLISFVFQINPREYAQRIDAINELNKTSGKNLKLDSPDGTIMACNFSNFKIEKKTEGGFVTWDANTDMVKMNYHISGYDEKINQAIVNRTQRDYEKQMIERGTFEVQDMAVQAGKYWTQKVKDIQTIYTAQTLGTIKSVEQLDKLIKDGKLPEDIAISSKAFTNILNGEYLLSPKGILNKDSVTVKSLMSLPLDALEFGENTVGVLSTSYFSNRATTEDTVGISRYELMKQDNPHLVEPYKKVYNKVNSMYNNELKSFADSVIKKINEKSNEKLLDSNGNYTEYGEYVMELIGQDIAKYAFLKAIGGSELRSKVLPNGEITYDYDKLKDATTLKALKINAHNPEDEAEMLAGKMQKGLKGLSDSDISFVADAINKRIAGTDTQSFRLAEALVAKSGLGLDWRLDAMKDVMDIDAVRNRDNDFDDTWNEEIKFWSKFVNGIKSVNKDSYIVAEITDVPDVMRDTTGPDSHPYDGVSDIGGKFNGEPESFVKLFNETGITTEAAYSYFFTNLLKVFSPEFAQAEAPDTLQNTLTPRLNLLLQTRNVDYLRNLYTFMGNHDKPRMIHGLALDIDLFHGNILNDYKNFSQGNRYRTDAIRVLSGAKTMKDVPIELRLNVDNNDYFKTVSLKAVAMSKLLLDNLYDLPESVISTEDKALIKDALIDLTNGNYLKEQTSDKLTTINIKELSSLDSAFHEILNLASKHGLTLTSKEKQKLVNEVVKTANSIDISDYLVHGDFDWESLDENVRKQNNAYAESILGAQGDFRKYSLYTIQLARLLKDAYGKTSGSKNSSAIESALKDFVEKYNRDTVNSSKSGFKQYEDNETAKRKNGYAARDIKTAIAMAVKQAEYKSGRQIANKEEFVDTLHKAATEPAVAKAEMIMEFLKGLFGNPTMYAGDEFGMTGYEEKTKNIYLQDRNALPREGIKGDSVGAKYRRTIYERMQNTLKDRSNPELHALNNGTPYLLDGVDIAEIKAKLYNVEQRLKTAKEGSPAQRQLLREKHLLEKQEATLAFMMQAANGDMTITVMNASDINPSNRVDYFEKFGLDTVEKRKKFFAENNIDSINPDNKYVPIQEKTEVDYLLLGAGVALPIGTIFMNANSKDKSAYEVKKIGNKLGIVKKGGGKIVLDGKTAKNGVMILKFLKKFGFKGRGVNNYYNPQYNTIAKTYAQPETTTEGKQLSVIAR